MKLSSTSEGSKFKALKEKQKDLHLFKDAMRQVSPNLHFDETTFSREEDMTTLWCPGTMSGANSLNSLPPLSERKPVPVVAVGP